MKRSSFILVSGIWILVSQISSAIVDSNNNGLSDPWEKHFNSGNLYTDLNPQADPDGDGWTNAQEVTAGTHPFDSSSPAGILRPDTVYSPEAWADSDGDGNLEHTPGAITLTWVMTPGKQYTVLYSPDLSEGSWQSLGESFIGNGNEIEIGLPFIQSGGVAPDKYFWRVAVEDIDSDSDELTNHEEFLAGTNPTISDTDGDMLSDHDEIIAGTDPNHADADYDGMEDRWETAHGLDPADWHDAYDDPDSDGIQNQYEYVLGFDPHDANTGGIADASKDRDDDGMKDWQEVPTGRFEWDYQQQKYVFFKVLDWEVADGNGDFDQDGLTNALELLNSTNVNNHDSDSDYLPDGWEIQHNLVATSSIQINGTWVYGYSGTNGSTGDPDADGIQNQYEYVLGFDPRNANTGGIADVSKDRDGDGIKDWQEAATGNWTYDYTQRRYAFVKVLDWENPDDDAQDLDGDGLSNALELTNHTNLLNPDTDGDGMWDGFEVQYGFNPLTYQNTQIDADADGYTNLEESQGETDPFDANDKPYRIVYSRPVSNETAVPCRKVLVFGLDRSLPMGVSIPPSFVTLDSTGQAVVGTVRVMSDRKSFAFISSAPFAPLSKYRISLKRGSTGIPVIRYSPVFITEKEVGAAEPFVMTSTPMDGNINVSRNITLSSYWSEPLDEGTFDASSASLTDSTGNQVPCNLRYDPFWHRLDLIPNAPLAADAKYTVSLGTTIRNLRGQALESSPTWVFTTLEDPLPIPATGPYVTSITPGLLARNIATTAAIEIVWNEAMNASTLNSTTCKLIKAWNGQEIPSTISYLGSGARLTITPQAALAENTAYTLHFTSEVRSAAGLAFAQPEEWAGYFRTGIEAAGEGVPVTPDPGWVNPGPGGPGIGFPPIHP